MATDEQRAAIERLRTAIAGDDPREWIDVEDVKLLLAEHPADDGAPIDRGWLKQVGAAIEDHPAKVRFVRSDALSVGLWDVDDGWKAMLFVTDQFQVCIVRGLKTRGQFRRLCAAINVPLKSQASDISSPGK